MFTTYNYISKNMILNSGFNKNDRLTPPYDDVRISNNFPFVGVKNNGTENRTRPRPSPAAHGHS